VSQLRVNIIANFAGKAWTALISLAFIPLYISFIGIEGYGLVGVYLALFAVFSLLDLGLGTTLNRELASLSTRAGSAQVMRDLVRTLELIYWALAIVIGVLLTVLAPLIANYWINAGSLSTETIQDAIVIMGIAIALQFPFTLYSGGLMGLQRQVLLNGITATMATIRAVGAVLILWLISPTIEAFFLWQLSASLVQTLITRAVLQKRLPKPQSRTRFRADLVMGVWRFASGVTGISVMAVILTQADKVILSKVLSLEVFGYYTLAWMLASGLYYLIGPVFSAVFPRFSQLVTLENSKALTLLYHQSCQLMSVVILPVAILLALFSQEILLLWTGDATIANNTHLIVSLLVVGTAINGLMNIPYALLLAYRWTTLPFYMNAVAVVVLVPVVYFMAVYYGAIGAAAVWVVLNAGYVLVGLQFMHKRLLPGELRGWYTVDVAYPLVAALVVAGLGRWFLQYPLSAPLELVALAGLAVLTLSAPVMAAPQARTWIFQQFMNRKVWYGTQN